MKQQLDKPDVQRHMYTFDKIRYRMNVGKTDDELSISSIEYEYFYRGLFTTCILSINDKIIGIGTAKKDKRDCQNINIGDSVAFSKAVRDFLKRFML